MKWIDLTDDGHILALSLKMERGCCFVGGCNSNVSIGDFVQIEDAVEENANLLVATEIIILKE